MPTTGALRGETTSWSPELQAGADNGLVAQESAGLSTWTPSQATVGNEIHRVTIMQEPCAG